MANERKLDCVILGLLSHENLTGYEIKKRLDTGLTFFWGASFGSIYPTLKELVENGFAVKTDTAHHSRNQITYAITREGRQHLKDWLELPVKKDELRSETLLKLFFADGASRKTALGHIEDFEAKLRGELPYLTQAVKALEGVRDESNAHLYYLLTARFGAKVYETSLEWCAEAKASLGGDG